MTYVLDKLIICKSHGELVYDRDHDFGLGPIQIGRYFRADIVTDTETRFQRENRVTKFLIIKGSLKPNLLPNTY